MLGSDSGIISQAKCFEYAHHISRNKKRRLETSTTAQTTFFGAYCLRFHLLSCLQLALKLGPKQECQRSPADHIHSFEQKRKKKHIEHGAEDSLHAFV
jgi:hypothetical protein